MTEIVWAQSLADHLSDDTTVNTYMHEVQWKIYAIDFVSL